MGAPEKLATSNNNSMQRVKVYRLNDDGKWDDQGTGHVNVDYLERSEELGLFVIDEEDNETLLMHPIISDDIYRKEEDTIITWRDSKNSTEIALSFQETKGCWYIWDHICNQQRNLRSDTIHRPKFETLFPPKGDTKKKVEDFLALPVKERTFRTVSGGSLKEKEHSSPLPCESSNTSKMSTGSRFTRTAPYFSLSDIDDLIAGDPVVNVEGIPCPVTKKQKIKPASHEAKKRKVVVEMDNTFAGMGPSEICDKLMAMTRDAVAHISTGIEREAVAGRKETEAKLVEKSKLLEKMEKEKDILVIKKGRELTEKDEEIARLTNKIAELEGNHHKEMEGFFKEAKVSAAKTVLQARLKMFQDLQEGKEASWDAEKWRQSLRKLTGEEEETG